MLARNIVIGFGIAIIFPLLIHYGVATFYPAPRYEQATITLSANPTTDERRLQAEQQKQRQDAYAQAARQFYRILAVVATPLGLAAILIGVYISFQTVGTGLILGGILAITWGQWGYWSFLDNWVRFISLLSGFSVLLFVGIRRVPPDTRNEANPSKPV